MKQLYLFLFCSSILFGAILDDTPTESSLIVYNGNIGLVSEKRELNINKGDKEIIYRGVASSIETDSVNITLPNSVTLYSQQYRFDKLTMSKLLDAHIGKEVKIAQNSVTLLSFESNNALVKDANGSIVSVLNKDITFSSIPTSLLTKPSLVWNIDAKKNITSNIDINYLIKKLSWKSDYILNLKENRADLIGWITIDNRSGKNYENIDLHVLAGELNKVNKRATQRIYKEMRAMADSPQVAHKAHEGYHLYSIPFKVNLANNEKTQIKFISKDAIPIVRKYSSKLSNPLYLHSEIKHSVTQYIEIQKLDFALPKGVVRTYSKLKNQKILLGESSLPHTPKQTTIKLPLGKNFDISVKESIQNRSDNKNYLGASVLYSIKNSSDEMKIVEILVPFNRNSTSTIDTKIPYSFKNGNLISFNIIINPMKTQQFNVKFRSKR